jgi:hypothetical protein
MNAGSRPLPFYEVDDNTADWQQVLPPLANKNVML